MALWATLHFDARRPFYKARLDACAECPLNHNGFCGTTGEFVKGTDEPFGCWCLNELSAQIESKACWARSNGAAFGWPATGTTRAGGGATRV